MKCKWLFIIAFISAPASASTAWQQWQPVADNAAAAMIKHYERQYPHADVNVTIDLPDNRLQLKACDENLTLDLANPPSNGGNLSVLVKCESQAPWSIYLKGQAEIWQQVVVTRRPLGRGDVIEPADVALKAFNLAEIRSGALFTPEAAIGKETRRQLKAGFPIKINQLNEPMVIRRGDSVQIAASAGGLKVLMTGTALANGRLGQQIPVSNNRSNRKVRAKVVAEGRVEVPM
ncbi:flagellar basal body P-ring formation protein FlgA [Simiduia sp. 21SJ11W-1]|uniref:flagellar basal body P-ring formation chaperone FlgA n=1 Tax=Simiduia sp. 21SJ11W-1 TaxID=2909669 RepID=UPI00209E0C3D|nr:flagellar basal body P-ring formation chaperone FlgA [Simiduia sp. 21SJ11W-1]UTA49456.1 flagellar basal body P-ring formation protein FlgA [Simiduia sp. 21SJ11W-1]